MKAVVAPVHGGPEVLEVQDTVDPTLLPGSVRVEVEAASVNYPDALILSNRYQVKIETPYVPGCEFSGHVLELGDGVTGFEPGDQVIGLTTSGAFAEQIVIEAERLVKLPVALDPLLAAAFGVTYTTAYHALVTMAEMSAGDWVVVLGAAGGVGLACVEVAHLLGGKVIAAASTDEKLAACTEMGADSGINYATEDLRDRIKALTGGGADVVIDPVGGQYSEPALRATRWGGRFVVVGFASGEVPRIPLNLVLLKGVRILGFENRTIIEHLPDIGPNHRKEAFRLFAEGKLKPRVSAVYPLEQAGLAIADITERRVVGKVVIAVRAK